MVNSFKVSVIIIFLNAERFLQEAIESVCSQSYADWELLLVDDGSTDGSSEIALRTVATKPERIRYLTHAGHQNRGMSASRNLGIHHAQGRYVSFLDADDVWLPKKLEQQVAILDSHPEAGFLYGQTELWYSWTGDASDARRDHVNRLDLPLNSLIAPPDLLGLCLNNEFRYPSMNSIMVKKEVVDKVGGFEESFPGTFHDLVFHSKILLCASTYVSSEVWDRYRQHPDSSCANLARQGRIIYERQEYLLWLANKLSVNGIIAPEIWKPLRKLLWPANHPVLHGILSWLRRRLVSIAKLVLPNSLCDWLRHHQPKSLVQFGNDESVWH